MLLSWHHRQLSAPDSRGWQRISRVTLAAALLYLSGPIFLIPTVSHAKTARVVLVFGDSLSAAYGMRADQGWVALLRKKLAAPEYGYAVVNASVSGETTAGGRARLKRTLDLHRPAIAILELGANDGLRGLPLAETQANLDAMIMLARDTGAQVLLVGMRMPTNYGPKYTKQFQSLFGELAGRHKLPFVPFLLEGVALDTRLMQPDGLHPNAAAQDKLLDTVWRTLRPLLRPNPHQISCFNADPAVKAGAVGCGNPQIRRVSAPNSTYLHSR